MIKTFANRFLKWFCHPDYYDEILGDLEELYSRKACSDDELNQWSYLFQVIKLLRPSLIRPFFLNQPAMLNVMTKTDFKIFLRSLKKKPFNSLTNLTALSVGIASILLITVYLNHELSFDQHQSNKDRTYRIVLGLTTNSGNNLATADNFIGLAHTLNNDFPEVENAVRLFDYKGEVEVRFKSGNKRVYKGKHFYRTEQAVFDVFDHQFIAGNPQKALVSPKSIVITESLSKTYFGKTEPLNKPLFLDNIVYKVTGVIEDIPKESDLYYEALTSFDFNDGFTFPDGNSDWGNPMAYTYAVLKKGTSVEQFQEKLNKVVKTKTDNFVMANYDLKSDIKMYPQSLANIHFEAPILSDTPKGNLVYINILMILGVIIFLIVAFNYGNYMAAYYTERVKEVNIRKHFGASKWMILQNIVGEMVLIAFAVLFLSTLVFSYCIPYVNGLTNNAIGFASLFSGQILILISVMVVLITITAIVFPLQFLVGNRTQDIMSGAISLKGGTTLRRGLLGVQFLCTTLLVFFSLTVFYQIQFLEDKSLGFDAEQVLAVDIPEAAVNDDKTAVLKQNLVQLNAIDQVSVVSDKSTPGNLNSNYQLGWVFLEDEKIEANFNFFQVDEDFASLLDIQLLEGTDFTLSTTLKTDQVLVNEAFVRSIGYNSPQSAVGSVVHAFDDRYEIVGVVENFHFEGIQKSILPLVISNNAQFGIDAKRILVKLNTKEGLAEIQDQLFAVNPSLIFEYTFIDEQFDQLFHQERTIGKMTGIFCFISIILAVIGLYSISGLNLEQRAKEIGIRKILGAEMGSITSLLGKEFLWLVLISFTTALPIAWSLATIWLEQFAYRIELGSFIFIDAMLIVCLVTILGVGINLVKGNNINPATMLRAN